jgi:hypothetical protein
MPTTIWTTTNPTRTRTETGALGSLISRACSHAGAVHAPHADFGVRVRLLAPVTHGCRASPGLTIDGLPAEVPAVESYVCGRREDGPWRAAANLIAAPERRYRRPRLRWRKSPDDHHR